MLILGIGGKEKIWRRKKKVLRGKLEIQKLVFPNESTIFVTCPKAGATSQRNNLR